MQQLRLIFSNLKATNVLICLIAPYLPNISYISSAVILYGRFLTYNILFTSGGSLTCIKTKYYLLEIIYQKLFKNLKYTLLNIILINNYIFLKKSSFCKIKQYVQISSFITNNNIQVKNRTNKFYKLSTVDIQQPKQNVS